MPAEWVWMRHEEHGGVARFPADVASQHEPRGWKPCDEPAALDPSEDPKLVDLPAPVAEVVTPKPGPKPASPKTPAGRSASGDPKE